MLLQLARWAGEVGEPRLIEASLQVEVARAASKKALQVEVAREWAIETEDPSESPTRNPSTGPSETPSGVHCALYHQ